MEFDNYLEKLEFRAAMKRTRGINNYKQQVAKEICDWLRTNEMGLWMGVMNRIDPGELKGKLDYMKNRGIKNSHYLLVCTKKK